MNILILGLNYTPEPVGIGPYTAGMAQSLVAAGHQVSVVSGKPYYPHWKTDPAFAGIGYRQSIEDGVKIVRCPIYVPATPSGPKRILHYVSFAVSMLPHAVRIARRVGPQMVIAIAPSVIAVPVARLAARIAGAKLWIHIQDFEVEAAFATGLLDGKSTFGRLARSFESNQLRHSDRVSSISPQMCRKLEKKGVPRARIVEFRNWAEVDAIRPLAKPSDYRAEWKITTPHVALYSGNIANKQGIEIIIEAARLLRKRTDLTFVICGEGSNRANLEVLAADLDNVRLHDLQPRERLGELLGLASVHLLPQIVGAADLVLPSKLANMLASGRPVVATAAPGTGLFDEVEGVGRATPPGDATAFARGIEGLLANPAEHARLGLAARRRAEERWSRGTLLAGFAKAVSELEKPDSALSRAHSG